MPTGSGGICTVAEISEFQRCRRIQEVDGKFQLQCQGRPLQSESTILAAPMRELEES